MPFKVKYRSMLKKQTKLSTMSLWFWLDFLSSYVWNVYFQQGQDTTRHKKYTVSSSSCILARYTIYTVSASSCILDIQYTLYLLLKAVY